MRSVPVDDRVDLLEQFVQLVPYGGVAGGIGRERVGEGEKGQQGVVREGAKARRGWCLLVVGGRRRRDVVEGAEGAVFALWRWRWGYEVA